VSKRIEDTVPPEVFSAASWIREWFPDDAVFIGGFGVNLHCISLEGLSDLASYTHDVDIFISRTALVDLVDLEVVVSNKRRSKSQFTKFGIEVDVYVEGKSSLAVDFDEIMPFSEHVSGFRVASLEHIMVLKSYAWLNRSGSDKGRKDELDICLLLMALASKGFRKQLLSYLPQAFLDDMDKVFSMRNLSALFSGDAHLAHKAWHGTMPIVSQIKGLFDGPPLSPPRI
jgi:hypothetical protein